MRALAGLAAGIATLVVAGPAHAATSISFYSDHGDFIGGGRQRVFEPANTSSLGAAMDGDTVVAWAVGGPYGEGYSFEFAAPPGEQLEPRNYIGAQRLPFRTSRPSRSRRDRGEPRLQHARRALRVARPDA